MQQAYNITIRIEALDVTPLLLLLTYYLFTVIVDYYLNTGFGDTTTVSRSKLID